MKRLRNISLMLLAMVLLWRCGDKEQPGEGDVFMRIYGTDGDDKGFDVVQAADGGFAVTGVLYSDSSDGNGQPLEGDIFLLRTNEFGEPLAYTKFANPGADVAKELILLDDGGFLIAGEQSNGINGGVDMVAIRTDGSGAVVWQLQLGGSGDDYGSAVVQTGDGNWVFTGYSSSNTVGGNYDVIVMKLDNDGNILLGNSVGSDEEERAFSAVATSDGGLAVSGLAVDTALGYQAVVWKLRDDLSLEWEYRQGGPSEDKGYSIDLLSSGNLVFMGYTSDGGGYDLFVTELTASGGVVSDTTFGGADYDRMLSQHVVQPTAGSLVGIAYTQSYGHGANDIYFYELARTDAGYVLSGDEYYGGSNDDIGANIVACQGGSLAIVGYSKSFTFEGKNDIVLLKVRASGALE
ncbi:MAG: hypothetical protein U0176_06885 [Bacteroidia bacterium]